MFWRFGFHSASTIDSLLDKEDVQLEAILDEDDLLQECKAQNTRLIDYFQRVDVLQRLFAYVTGQIDCDEKGRFKYPYVATEVLCSEIWSIVETSINNQSQTLLPFWETVLDRSPDDMTAHLPMATHFAKINSVFMTKKPAEMFAFIRSQPNVVDRLLLHIEVPPIVDLLVRIIQLDEQPTGDGVLEWLSSENLIGKLLDLLSPAHTSDTHTVVTDLIKGIISMATPSPGAGITDNHTGSASNRFAREIAQRKNIETLTLYMLIDFSAPSPPDDDHETDTAPLPNLESQTSSVVQSISLVIELIRKNNSDYFEPFLFHTLRNRLIQVQQQHLQDDDGRDALEKAMKEMVDRIGVVHLGSVLETLIPNLHALQIFLTRPRSVNGPIKTTLGPLMPLSFERYRISELFAELLHCSNMALLNRAPAADRLYDADGRLHGGLAALEELAQVISLSSGSSSGRDDTQDQDEDEDDSGLPPLEGLPIARHVRHGEGAGPGPGTSFGVDFADEYMSEDEESGSEDDDAMEEIAMEDDNTTVIGGGIKTGSPVLSLSPVALGGSPRPGRSPVSLSPTNGHELSLSSSSLSLCSQTSRRNSRRTTVPGAAAAEAPEAPPPVGERLKKRYIEINILTTLLDLFFEFPWNNFLHSAVYDLVHQILTGNVESGVNRELVVALFRDAGLMHRIVEGQRRSDIEAAKPKGVRLGYMGHLTLISEDVLTALERFPPELRLVLIEHAPVPGWDEYVTGRYDETRKRDARVLGGGKPGVARSVARWKVDEDDGEDEGGMGMCVSAGTVKGEFRRASSVGPPAKSTADFGLIKAEVEEESQPAPQFARYLAQEMHSSDNMGSDDDEEDEGGWLSQSTFSLGPPPVSARHRSTSAERRPLSLNTHGFDDSFGAGSSAVHRMSEDDPFNPHIDDAFSDAPTDSFTFPSSSSDEMEDSSFDSGFGDFGEFQSAGDGELTPTTGSWTFASGSSTDEAGSESGRSEDLDTVTFELDLSPREERRRL